MCQTVNIKHFTYKKTAPCSIILSLLIFIAVLSPPIHAQAASGETVDALLDIERKIALTKRMLELRKLQIKQQDMEMGMFKSKTGIQNGPVIIRTPDIRLESIYTYKNKLMAALRYGDQLLSISKGDNIDQGVKVLNITNQGVVLNIHGSKRNIGIDHSESEPTPSSNGIVQ